MNKPELQFAGVELYFVDLRRAKEFYREVLGIEIEEDDPAHHEVPAWRPFPLPGKKGGGKLSVARQGGPLLRSPRPGTVHRENWSRTDSSGWATGGSSPVFCTIRRAITSCSYRNRALSPQEPAFATFYFRYASFQKRSKLSGTPGPNGRLS